MLAFRIVLAGAVVVLAAPATALATNADGATPTATPLLLELALAALVVASLLARRRIARLARAAASRLAHLRVGRRHSRRARVNER
jgi:hypothetical protein